jgi:manganese efflux pump family protein
MAEFLPTLLIAVGLSADCFAVALALGCTTRRASIVLRVAAFFGIFQWGMCLGGWLLGTTFVNLIAAYDHWVAFALLLTVGGRMIWESFHEEHEAKLDVTRWWVLLTLSVATSIDSLAVGLSFALVRTAILPASLTIGVTALVITLLGFLLGRRVGEVLGKRAELVGGLILIGIGVRILVGGVVG